MSEPEIKQRKLESVEENRRLFIELLITSIVFGVTLNLISDLISSVYEQFILQVALVASIVTILLLYGMFRMILAPITPFEKEIQLTLIWDSKSGSFHHRDTGYFPQKILQGMLGGNPKQIYVPYQTRLKQTPVQILMNDADLITELTEILLFDIFNRITAGIKESDLIPLNTFYDGSKWKNDAICDRLDDLKIPMQQLGRPKYKRTKDKGGGKLTIKFKGGLLGTYSLEFKLKKIDWFEDVPDSDMVIDSFYLDEFAKAVVQIAEIYQQISPEIFEKRKLDIPTKKTKSPIIRADVAIKIKFKFSSTIFYIKPRWIHDKEKWVTSFTSSFSEIIDWRRYLALVVSQQMQKSVFYRRLTGQY
ncbi:MAG: hypothetical protein GF411_20030 [Candidatus Lokiarchaeota archaeon]|nr:hypothetical protein [Candidatus Lokiarchaeota archaeon]